MWGGTWAVGRTDLAGMDVVGGMGGWCGINSEFGCDSPLILLRAGAATDSEGLWKENITGKAAGVLL